jgi:anti-sigma B factor antagonist
MENRYALDLEVTTSAVVDEAFFVRVAGELDAASVGRLESVLEDAITRGARRIEMDLSRLSFVDSSGLAVLIRAQQRVAARGGALAIEPASEPARRLFEVAGVSELFGTQ